MSFNLISDLIDRNSFLYFMFQSRLDRYIAQQKEELNGVSYFHDDKPLVDKALRYFVTGRHAPQYVFYGQLSNKGGIYYDMFKKVYGSGLPAAGRSCCVDN